ncbi:MAG: NrsF family protein [Pseudomonadota bacterium]|nr:NrsF family protein [Pseudomonadota bacterium]
MSGRSTEELISALASKAQPVKPLAPPLKRALATIAILAALAAAAILLFSKWPHLLLRYAGREHFMVLEMAATLATGALAVTGAFFLSIPGRSKRWLLAPIIPFLAWLTLSGLGCYDHLITNGRSGWQLGSSVDCLLFIGAASLVLSLPLVWRVSRARPVDPVPVALLTGLGAAAFSAFLLQFFHPSAVTFLDLAVHMAAIVMVIAAMALLNRRALAPA